MNKNSITALFSHYWHAKVLNSDLMFSINMVFIIINNNNPNHLVGEGGCGVVVLDYRAH